jgi:hypothetical protein
MNIVTSHIRAGVAVAADDQGRIGIGPRAWMKYAVEAIGTFFLVFTVGAAVGSRSPLAPLAIGAALMVMVYAGGHLSGGHYNPAVTVASLVRRRIGLRDAAGYWFAQFGGGVLAAPVVGVYPFGGRVADLPTIVAVGPFDAPGAPTNSSMCSPAWESSWAARTAQRSCATGDHVGVTAGRM